jgi:hypothetical protein
MIQIQIAQVGQVLRPGDQQVRLGFLKEIEILDCNLADPKLIEQLRAKDTNVS